MHNVMLLLTGLRLMRVQRCQMLSRAVVMSTLFDNPSPSPRGSSCASRIDTQHHSQQCKV